MSILFTSYCLARCLNEHVVRFADSLVAPPAATPSARVTSPSVTKRDNMDSPDTWSDSAQACHGPPFPSPQRTGLAEST